MEVIYVLILVGLQGFPNAGKSSLLAAVTAAKPEIAAYPFTTLVPNLGCLEGDPLKNDGGFSRGATMADLPGLIKDAHLGKVISIWNQTCHELDCPCNF